MSKTTDIEFKVSDGARITKKEKEEDGSYITTIKIKKGVDTIQVFTKPIEPSKSFLDDCRLIKASTYTLDNPILGYEPFRSNLYDLIKKGKLEDFYIPGLDPSFDENFGVQYLAGQPPAVGETPDWWAGTARSLAPRNSGYKAELGSYGKHYLPFLVEIVELLQRQRGYSLKKAIEIVKYDSRMLGHYINSESAKHTFEPTGSRSNFGFSDLGNTFKILKDDKRRNGYVYAGGCFNSSSKRNPLCTASKDYGTLLDKYSTGWIVFTPTKPRQKKCEKQKETIVIPKETIIVTEEQKQCD